jgi:hypothetical protein
MSAPSREPSSRWVHSDLRYATTPGVDPELEWALGPGKDTFFTLERQQRWVPVMIELQDMTVAEFAAGTGFLDDGPSRTMWQANVRVSPLYESTEDAPGLSYCTAMVKLGFFEFLRRSDSLKKSVVGVSLGLPLGAESLGPTVPVTNSGHGGS